MLNIGLIGKFQSGKSLLINCLLKRHVATVGSGTATTHVVAVYRFTDGEESIRYFDTRWHQVGINSGKALDTDDSIKVAEYSLNCDFLKDITLFDLPGSGFNNEDNAAFEGALQHLDYALVINTNYKQAALNYELECLKKYTVPYYFVLNCAKTSQDFWDPACEYNLDIYNASLQMLDSYPPLSHPFGQEQPLIVNLMWYWASMFREDPSAECYGTLINYEFGKESGLMEPASNFSQILKIFDMDNKAYLELKKELHDEMNSLRDSICPVGTIQAFAFSRMPNDGWFECDGRQMEVEDYPELFKAIGFTFGGNGRNKFNLPDLRGRFLRGWDHSAGTDSGRQFGSFQDDCFQQHGHSFETESQCTSEGGKHFHYVYTQYHQVSGLGRTDSDWVHDGYGSDCKMKDTSTTGAHSHRLPNMSVKGVKAINGNQVKVNVMETRPKNVAMLFCIKAKSGSGTSAKNSLFEAPCSQAVELKDLYTSGNGKQFEGFIWLEASRFKIKYEGHDVNDRIVLEVIDQNTIAEYHCYNGTCHVDTGGLYFIKYRKTGQHNGVSEAELTAKKIESMGIIGSFNQWSESVKMTQYPFRPLLYTVVVKMKAGDTYKFRANDAWGLGELDGDCYGNLTPHRTTDLICYETGDYRVFLDLEHLTVSPERFK